MTGAELFAATKMPPERAVAYMRGKGLAVSDAWHEVWEAAHAKAFTVARALKLDVLEDIHAEVLKIAGEGITEAEFVKALTPRLKARGWWGREERVDPETGEVTEVTLGSPHRLKTIYRANAQTAYQAGRYRAFEENRAARPFWQYVAVLDARTRPAHAAMDGKVFALDDPATGIFWPPNDWGCRCRGRALSAGEVAARGLQVEDTTGKISWEEVPVGKQGESRPRAVYRTTDALGQPATMKAGAGWSYNPGQAWGRFDVGGALPDQVEAPAAGAAVVRPVQGQPTWRDLGRPDLREVAAAERLPAPERLPAGATAEQAHDMLAAALGVSPERPLRTVHTPAAEQVALRYEHLAHVVEKRADARERYGNFVVPTLEKPFEVWLTEYEDGFRTRYVGLFEGRENLLVVVRVNRDGSVFWNAMQADDRRLNRQREGRALLWKK